MHPVRAFFDDFEWSHTGLGLIGSIGSAVVKLWRVEDRVDTRS